MNKQQIIDKLQSHLVDKGTIYPKWELKEIVESLLAIISDSQKQGEDVSLSNFGRFSIKVHKGRKFHNIHTGCIEYIPGKPIISFSVKKDRRK